MTPLLTARRGRPNDQTAAPTRPISTSVGTYIGENARYCHIHAISGSKIARESHHKHQFLKYVEKSERTLRRTTPWTANCCYAKNVAEVTLVICRVANIEAFSISLDVLNSEKEMAEQHHGRSRRNGHDDNIFLVYRRFETNCGLLWRIG